MLLPDNPDCILNLCHSPFRLDRFNRDRAGERPRFRYSQQGGHACGSAGREYVPFDRGLDLVGFVRDATDPYRIPLLVGQDDRAYTN